MPFKGARIVAALGMAVIAATAALAQEETVRAVNFLPNNQSFGRPFVDYVSLVNAAGKGAIQIAILPSGTMSPFDMGVAIKNGAVDMGNVPATFFQNLLPVGEAVKLGNTTAAEQRANGAFDLMDKLYQEKVNAKLLSIWGHEAQFHAYLRAKPIDSATLAGFKMRTTPIYRAFFRSLGADLIQAPPGEVYTLLERGAVDGYGWPLWDIKSPGWDRVTRYRVEPGFYAVTSSIHINLDKWRKLSKAQQDVLAGQAIA
ncbi:MAG: TRAP transporter substrate-binding protein DctP, partial [Burkholderiales bacterium]